MITSLIFRRAVLYSGVLSNSRLYSAFGHDNLKGITLRKKLITTVIFGGTLVVALWCKKRRKVPEALLESTLLKKNDLYQSSLSLYEYKGFVLPKFALTNVSDLSKFVCRDDDIFVASFPKTGTTWLQEIIYCIMHDLDSMSTNESIEDRFPYLEFVYPGVSSIEKMPSQRFMKTHLPYSLLPEDVKEKKPKILYVIRNPKDVTVSYYHFLRMFTVSNYVGTFNEFANDMLEDKVPYGPLWKHYLDIWSHKDDENVLILFYEDLHKDVHGNIRKIADFLGKSLTDQDVEKIARHCSFSEMASNPSVNYAHWDDLGMRNKNETKFMRKGKVGDWKNYFTSELNGRMETWINERLGNFGLQFTYETVTDGSFEK